MAERRIGWRLAGFALGFATLSTGAQAHVQLYQIVRLITFKTECRIATLNPKPAQDRGLHFIATCENVSFYPDGIDVTCGDPEDDRSCRVETAAKTFDNLHMLDRK